MLRTMSLTDSLTILQSLIDAVDEDDFSRGKSDINETNLSNLSASKKYTGAGYLNFEGVKRGNGNINTGSGNTNSGDGNTKKSVKAAKGFNYLTSNAKKIVNQLRHTFIQALIFQNFNLEYHIRIGTDALYYAINKF